MSGDSLSVRPLRLRRIARRQRVGYGRPRRAVVGHEATFACAATRTLGRLLQPVSGRSIDVDAGRILANLIIFSGVLSMSREWPLRSESSDCAKAEQPEEIVTADAVGTFSNRRERGSALKGRQFLNENFPCLTGD